MTAVENAFRWARIQAVRHMAARERTGMEWSAPTITEIMTAHTSRVVTVVPFTQRAEALIGADWVWWCADGADAHGMRSQRCGLELGGEPAKLVPLGPTGRCASRWAFTRSPHVQIAAGRRSLPLGGSETAHATQEQHNHPRHLHLPGRWITQAIGRALQYGLRDYGRRLLGYGTSLKPDVAVALWVTVGRTWRWVSRSGARVAEESGAHYRGTALCCLSARPRDPTDCR